MEETETQTESPTTKPYAKLSLRKEPNDFYDREWNPNGSFDNDFVDNGDGTVTDRVTDLIWQKDGSPKPLTLKRATYYIGSLNDKRFMGYSDWRLPTIEELASLITGNVRGGIYINPLFTTKRKSCWSSDSGQVLADHTHRIFDYPETYYVRGVRSAR
jgi:hypothetical protein